MISSKQLLGASIGLLVILTTACIASPAVSGASSNAAAFTCEPATAANEIPAPPSIWKLSGKPPSAEEISYEAKIKPLCTAGHVPVPTADGPAAPLQTPTKSLGASQLALVPGERTAVPPAYNGEKCQIGGCYWHVADQVSKSAIGMEYTTTVSEPHVSSFPNAHSVDQLAVSAGGSGHLYNTIEAGIDVDPGMFGGSSKPHFFIYLNNNEYSGPPDCYDCNYHSYYEAKIAPGGELPTGATNFRIGVEFWGGDWWIWAGTQWIAYVEPGFWPNDDFTKGELEQNFGEVFDNEATPTSQMGDGEPGSSASATPMTAPIIMITENKEKTTSLSKELITDSALYSLGSVNSGRTEWHFGGSGDPDPPPVVVTEPSNEWTETSALMHGSVDPSGGETYYQFEYGTTTSYGQTTPASPGGYLGKGTTFIPCYNYAYSLPPNTEYHYRIVAWNHEGTSHGSDMTFRTLAAPPTVTTGGATNVEEEDVLEANATLTGTVNPKNSETHYYFEYGPTTSYGSIAPALPGTNLEPVNSSVPASTVITGLPGGSTYHYRLVASNAAGTSNGGDQTFSTPLTPSPRLQEVTEGYREMFVEGPNHTLLQVFPAKEGGWTTLTISASNAVYSDPVLVEKTKGYREIWVQGPNHSLWQYFPAKEGGWTGFEAAGNDTTYSSPKIEEISAGYPEVWVQGPNHSLWQYFPAKEGGWAGFEVAGNNTTYSNPYLQEISKGYREVWVQGPNHSLWQYFPAKEGGWAGFEVAGNDTTYSTSIQIQEISKGYREVWVQGPNHSLWQYFPAKEGGWAGFEVAGNDTTYSTSIQIQEISKGYREVWVQGPNHSLWQYFPAKEGGWAGFEVSGENAIYSNPFLQEITKGYREVFVQGPAHSLVQYFPAKEGGWTSFTMVSNAFSY